MSKKRRGRGEGSIEILPSGKYRAVVSSVDPLTGKRLKTTSTFATKDEAVAWRNAMIAEKNTNASGGRTVGKWLEEWLEVKKGKIADGSLEMVQAAEPVSTSRLSLVSYPWRNWTSSFATAWCAN